MCFLRLPLADRAPDATTVGLYRRLLVPTEVPEDLFAAFYGYARAQVGAGDGRPDNRPSVLPGSRPHHEHAAIKAGEAPEGRDERPAKRRWKEKAIPAGPQKHGKSHDGYTNPVNVDRRHKLSRCNAFTDSSVHDSRTPEDILVDDDNASDVRADSACRSAETEKKPAQRGLVRRIHRKAHRNRPLSRR